MKGFVSKIRYFNHNAPDYSANLRTAKLKAEKEGRLLSFLASRYKRQIQTTGEKYRKVQAAKKKRQVRAEKRKRDAIAGGFHYFDEPCKPLVHEELIKNSQKDDK
jgi:hypothetical protein